MISVKQVRLPTHFEENESANMDDRFLKVKIYVAHTGENLNNSIFTREALENISSSLPYIPILGYVKNTGDDEKDFGGHEKRIKWNGNDIEVSFDTRPYGFVPKDANTHFETTGGKEWLVCDGYLWTRFNDAINIFAEADGSKGQSMEIRDPEGYVDEEGRMVFTNATFAGLCILGDDTAPAMTGSTVSIEFGKDDVKSSIQEMLAEFTAEKGAYALDTEEELKKKNQTHDQNNDDDETKTPVEPTEPSEPTEPEEPEPTNPDEGDGGDTGKPDEGDGKDPEPSEGDNGDDKEPEQPTEPETPEEPEEGNDGENGEDDTETPEEGENPTEGDSGDDDGTSESDGDPESGSGESGSESGDAGTESFSYEEFEASLTDKIDAVRSAIRAKHDDHDHGVYVTDIYEDHVVYEYHTYTEGGVSEQYFDAKYSIDADLNVVIGEEVEVFPEYVTAQEKQEIEDQRAEVESLKAELARLTAYEADEENAKKQEVLDKAKEEITSDQFTAIQDKFKDLDVTGVKKEVAFAIYEQNEEFSVESTNAVPVVNFTAKEDHGYGTANKLFHK